MPRSIWFKALLLFVALWAPLSLSLIHISEPTRHL
ncbi:hypothetical protein ACX3V1_00260, partial [Escherichia coli]